MRNILLDLSYLGTYFFGFQKQKNALTVQGLLEKTLEDITGEKVKVVGSGRTDRGVHALSQICNFHTNSRLTPQEFEKALNSLLPPQIRVNRALEVDENFHSRICAKGKIYCYFVWTDRILPPFLLNFAFHFPFSLDSERMRASLHEIKGKHDFSSFAKAGSFKGNPLREIKRAELVEDPPLLCFLFEGSGFLQHMVRAIVGTILEVGRGKFHPGKISEILKSKDRRFAGPTVPPEGLFLVKVLY